jgi:hypothetical protein
VELTREGDALASAQQRSASEENEAARCQLSMEWGGAWWALAAEMRDETYSRVRVCEGYER